MSDKETIPTEKFTAGQHLEAVKLFLDYGTKTLVREGMHRDSCGLGHKGYFSGIGWAARSLRSLRDHLKKPPVERIIEEMRELTDDQRHEIVLSCCRHCGSLNTSCNCWNDE
jgi:hypothetical protein